MQVHTFLKRFRVQGFGLKVKSKRESAYAKKSKKNIAAA